MIQCVTLETNHYFEGNLILAQHKLRYESIIERQHWDVPCVREMEFDSYDNPAAYYLVKTDHQGKAIATSRFYPTDRPYMLEEAFSHLVTKCPLPKDVSVWEGSRFCINANLPPEQRKRIAQELVVGYLEFALAHGIKSIIGVMYPIYWKNLFIKSGWNVEWMGEVQKSQEGHTIVAGNLKVSPEVLANVRQLTGIHEEVLIQPTKKLLKKAA